MIIEKSIKVSSPNLGLLYLLKESGFTESRTTRRNGQLNIMYEQDIQRGPNLSVFYGRAYIRHPAMQDRLYIGREKWTDEPSMIDPEWITNTLRWRTNQHEYMAREIFMAAPR